VKFDSMTERVTLEPAVIRAPLGRVTPLKFDAATLAAPAPVRSISPVEADVVRRETERPVIVALVDEVSTIIGRPLKVKEQLHTKSVRISEPVGLTLINEYPVVCVVVLGANDELRICRVDAVHENSAECVSPSLEPQTISSWKNDAAPLDVITAPSPAISVRTDNAVFGDDPFTAAVSDPLSVSVSANSMLSSTAIFFDSPLSRVVHR
jgi:hypothetical protein